jgi:hypothetical protein
LRHVVYLRIFLTAGAVALAVVHGIWPRLSVDGVTLGLLCVAALPWLAPIIKSIELPGFGKIELQEMKAQVEELRGQTASASQKADAALASKTTSLAGGIQNPDVLPPDDRFLGLAEKYNEIRTTQEPGATRAGAMTAIIGDLLTIASSMRDVVVGPLLMDKDAGKRLFAYAYLYSHPDPAALADLVRSVTVMEDKPFGQYWGIQAIGRVILAAPKSINSNIREALQSFLTKLKKGTDSYYELSRILKSLDDSP